MTEATTHTYTVDGMSCGHCAASVDEELTEVEGVLDVAVDLATGRVRVTAAGVDEGEIRAAVEQAGYSLAAAR